LGDWRGHEGGKEPLPAGSKEGLRERRRDFGENASGDINLMIEFGVGQDLETGTEGARVGVVRSIDQTLYASLYHSAGAHSAGLQGNVQSCAGEAIVAEPECGFTKDDHLGVGRGIGVAYGAVAGAGQHVACLNQDGADGDLSTKGGGPRLVESKLHEVKIVGHGRIEDNTGVQK
jgi:hypothetical protein